MTFISIAVALSLQPNSGAVGEGPTCQQHGASVGSGTKTGEKPSKEWGIHGFIYGFIWFLIIFLWCCIDLGKPDLCFRSVHGNLMK